MQSLNFKVFTEFNTARRWPWLGRPRCRDITRICKTIACSSEKNIDGKGNETTGSFVFRSQTRVFLKQQIEVAAKSEDYKEAARITDSMRLFGEEEPVLHLRRLMKEAVANERFEGFRVQVRSLYIEDHSQPSMDQYLFFCVQDKNYQ
uniref:Uncharacterized protein n=1 Tax=Nelumbo nucifera TaxID=4432 RepID=A0A822YPV4_NELNU|nr:TPA_asm: hypothetical protein HUJ06_005187 [Nelumbo nucifera]